MGKDYRGRDLDITGMQVSDEYRILGSRGIRIGSDLVVLNDGEGGALSQLKRLSKADPTAAIIDGLKKEERQRRKVTRQLLSPTDMLVLCLLPRLSGMRPVEQGDQIVLPSVEFGKFTIGVWTTKAWRLLVPYQYES